MKKNIVKDDINADIFQRYGATVTRAQLLEYEQQTGVFAVWIYRGQRVGRGQYAVPGAPKKSAAAPTSRPVIPTPFDDDEPETTPKRPLRRNVEVKDPAVEAYDAPSDYRLKKMRALVCTTNFRHPRREDTYSEDMSRPVCSECGAKMYPHWWAVKVPREQQSVAV